jgi:hypothetical protein
MLISCRPGNISTWIRSRGSSSWKPRLSPSKAAITSSPPPWMRKIAILSALSGAPLYCCTTKVAVLHASSSRGSKKRQTRGVARRHVRVRDRSRRNIEPTYTSCASNPIQRKLPR